MSSLQIPFVDHGSTQQSAPGDGPRVVVATDAAETGLHLVTSARDDRLYLAVFAGTKRTGGFGVGVDSVMRDGERVVVRARFTEPPSGALVTQVLTSPAHLISIDRQQASGAREVVLVDDDGAEVARTAVPQSKL